MHGGTPVAQAISSPLFHPETRSQDHEFHAEPPLCPTMETMLHQVTHGACVKSHLVTKLYWLHLLLIQEAA